MPVVDVELLVAERVEAIQRFHRRCHTDRAQLDLSGGIDSAVMLALLARALGPENVAAVHSAIDSDPRGGDRAQETADALSVRLIRVDLSDPFHALVARVVEAAAAAGHDPDPIEGRRSADPLVDGSFRSCIRAPVGRYVNRLMGGGIRHGTGNECEDRWLRFYQKGGDGEVDTNLLAMLTKGEVYQLAPALGVPRSVISARPTPDLWASGDHHNDEDEIADYLGLPGAAGQGLAFYSYVDLDTGRYANVGLIERVSRFVDSPAGTSLFDDAIPEKALEAMTAAAQATTFRDIDAATTGAMLRAARRAEAATRHKYNPNIPTLGTRTDLVRDGALTDDLPVA